MPDQPNKPDRISKRKRLRNKAGLTPREQRYVSALIANGGNQTQAALVAAPHLTVESAKVWGSKALTNDTVRQAVMRGFEAQQITPDYLAANLRARIESPDERVGLEATKYAYKLAGAEPATKSVSLHAHAAAPSNADPRLVRWRLAHGRNPSPEELEALLAGQPVPVEDVPSD